MEYLAIAVPRSESEITVMVSLLIAHDIPHYVQNRGFGGLYPGMQIPIYNVQRLMVPIAHAEEAANLLAVFREEEPINLTQEKLRLSDRCRVVAELIFGGWALPFRRRRFDCGNEEDEQSF